MLVASKWDTKYLTSPILYKGRAVFTFNGQTLRNTQPYSLDVRNFISYPDFTLERVVKDEGIWNLPTAEEKAFACLQFVKKNVRYTPDKSQYGINEMWQFPHETMTLGRGDCEDGSVLMVSLMRHAGIPAFRVKVAAGNVVVGANAPLGGHAYTIFLREKDEEWIALDWCYFPTDFSTDERMPVKNDIRYKDVWFTFNDELGWSPQPIVVDKSVKSAITNYAPPTS